MGSAERLFAERGFAGVGIREIARAAGANTAAVNYHFESKENLWLEIMRRRAGPVNAERFRRLGEAKARAGGDPLSLGVITDALIGPVVDVLIDEKGEPDQLSIRLMTRLMVETPMLFREELLEFFAETRDRFAAALAESLPHCNPPEIQARFFYLVSAMTGLVVQAEMLSGANDCLPAKAFREVLLSCVSRTAAAIESPILANVRGQP